MAIWQVHISLKRTVSDKHIDSKLWESSMQGLANEFGKRESWDPDISQYGDLESTCIEIENVDIDNIYIDVRLDLRTLSKRQICIICDFAKNNDLLIQNHDKLLEATFDNVLQIIHNSRAYHFMQDPEIFLSNIGGAN